jgi:hypothetical protein
VDSSPGPEPKLPPPTPGGERSADGRWLWTGTAWIPYPAADLSDATPPRHEGPVHRLHLALTSQWFAAVVLIGWMILLGDWAPVLIEAVVDRSTMAGRPMGIPHEYALVLSTIGFGLILAQGKRPRLAEMLIAAVMGTGVLAAWYVNAMFANPQPGGTEDIAAGVGIVTFGPPTFLVILAILAAGFLAGRALHAILRSLF